jgi:recombining binding protein (suppressor of hairless)
MYSHSAFPDAPYPPSNGNPYEIGGLPSSYNGGKVSPLTPTDPVGGIHHPSPFAKDYPGPPSYSDLGPDRRNYPSTSDFEDYAINPQFPSSNTLPHFNERLAPRFSPDNRFNQPPPSHITSGHGSDIMRSVAPNATHSGYGPNSGPYENMSHMSNPGPPRIQSIDEHFVDMHLGRPMGNSSDLHSFIRHVL